MSVVFLVGVVLSLWQLALRTHGSPAVALISGWTPTRVVMRFAAVALVVAFVAQAYALDVQAWTVVPGRFAWLNALPIHVFDADHNDAVGEPYFSVALLVCGIVETIALGIVALAAARGITLGNGFVAFIVGAYACVSLASRSLSTTDVYEYVGTSLLGAHVYSLHAANFSHTMYAAVAEHIPVVGSIYGPLWVAINWCETAFGRDLYGKIEALRVANIVLLAATIAALRWARTGPTLPLVVLLNPFIWWYFVLNSHADLQWFLLLIMAYGFAKRASPWLAFVFLAMAGLVKFPFVVLGGVVLQPLARWNARVATWCGAIAVVGLSTLVVPGTVYLTTLAHFTAMHAQRNAKTYFYIVGPLCFALAALAVVARRRLTSAALFVHQMGPIAAPWYLLWGAPYVLTSERAMPYVVAMPVLGVLLDFAFVLNGVNRAIFVGTVVFAFVDVFVARERAKRSISPARAV